MRDGVHKFVHQVSMRPTVAAMETRLSAATPCLDHGFVRVVDYMGGDDAIVQAARVSYGSGTRRQSQDRDLIRYLMRHRHTTPFEMCEVKLHVKLPIFVARQWIRHRTASVNELSGRYSLLDREFYVPPAHSLAVQSTRNKQGRGASLSPQEAAEVLSIMKEDALRSHDHYESLMDRFSLARELARLELSLNFYTQWYWKIDLHNLLHFLRLRLHPHAQEEIRIYAGIIGDIVRDWVPTTWEAFQDFQLDAVTLSGPAVRTLRLLLRREEASPSQAGVSRREWQEIKQVFGLDDEGNPLS